STRRWRAEKSHRRQAEPTGHRLTNKGRLTFAKAEGVMTDSNNHISVPDLTKRPPRSPRQRLGGYALLPRMLDKGRAEIAGKSGEYHYNCPLDQRFVQFVGIDPAALREQLAAGKGDGEILAWINETAQHKRTPW